jgi:hypothetical protein
MYTVCPDARETRMASSTLRLSADRSLPHDLGPRTHARIEIIIY